MACCGHWNHGNQDFDGISCKSMCGMPPMDPASNDGDYQLCDTSAPVSDCPAMTACTSDPLLGGKDHGYCKP
jgi:hypothetical protein